jgi:hypothetical protein
MEQSYSQIQHPHLHYSLCTDGNKLIGIQLKGSMDRNHIKLLPQIPEMPNITHFCTLQLYMSREDRYEHSRSHFLLTARVVPAQIFYILCSVYFFRSGYLSRVVTILSLNIRRRGCVITYSLHPSI